MSNPIVSVIMPVYNAKDYLKNSVESILNQSLTDFEFIIIDDCSSDDSYQILQDYAKKDSRIRLFKNSTNKKLPTTLNFGIIESRGKYVARMDADDISLPERLALQVSFLERNINVDVCGTKIKPFTLNAEPIRHEIKTYEDNIDIAICNLFIYNVIIHPTVMIRKSVISNYLYDTTGSYIAEDYELWCRLLRNGVVFHNLQNVLLLYRVSKSQTTWLYQDKIESSAIRIRQENIKYYFRDKLTEEEIYVFINFYHQSKIKKLMLVNKFNKIVDKIMLLNENMNLFDVKRFNFLVGGVKPKYLSRIINCVINKFN